MQGAAPIHDQRSPAPDGGGEEDGMAQQRTFRALGGVDQGVEAPTGDAADALRQEFDRVLALKGSLRGDAEAAAAGAEVAGAEVAGAEVEAGPAAGVDG